MKYQNIREEELKNKVGADWFKSFDTTEILGNVDFTVCPKQVNIFGRTPLLWAEAKTGNFDVTTMFVQLVLTIGKARTFDKTLPPAFLGAFDFKKIAFVPYISVQDIFYINDFNWNVAPSNHDTKEFKLIKDRIEASLNQNSYIYDYQADEKDLKIFIANNIAKATEASKIKIDKNNFIPIYLRWLDVVKPAIDVNWDELKKANILDSDFYLADLFVDDKDTQIITDDLTIRDNLFVIFQNQGYKIEKENIKQMFDATINIKNNETYTQFWKRYKRPPINEFQNYIIERRDLLVPQDIRERKGAFFTPRIWVELSQKYLANYLGENWQEEYYIWDCAAGTGNLLAGLTNKYNIWASTLDQADVKVMHDRILHGANLLENHVFQFDFLNDDFFPSNSPSLRGQGGVNSTSSRGQGELGVPEGRGGKLPQALQDIINDPEKRKKIVIYINPPYAEATSATTVTGTSKNKGGVTTQFKINEYLNPKIGNATNEIFALFMANIYEKIPNCILGQFSTLKFVNGSNFKKFKEYFLADFVSGFIVPAETFDNVKGKFPIGFTIWDTSKKSKINTIATDIFDKNGDFTGIKYFYGELPNSINKWIVNHQTVKEKSIGTLFYRGNDFQNQKYIYTDKGSTKSHDSELYLNQNNIVQGSIYFAVRHCIEATWLNDRDQFLYPNDGWKTDTEFQNDCLAFTLFHGQNRISSAEGTNHWIPFTEQEVNSKEKFESNFMSQFIKGKIKNPEPQRNLFSNVNSSSLRGAGGVNSPSLRGAGGVKITPDYLQSHQIQTDKLIFSDNFLPYNPNLKENSKGLRKARNLSEVLLWKQLRADSFMGCSFYRQKPILNYIADFYSKELGLVIEIDGSSHHSNEAQKYDAERDRQMNVLGLTVLRISDESVKENMTKVLRELESVVKRLTPPSPIREGEFTLPDPLREGEFTFSTEATAVFNAGLELWKYYHKQKDINANASLYDIREYFQGRNEAGKMNNKSKDEKYMSLINDLREKLKQLANKIAPKVYEYEFLKQ